MKFFLLFIFVLECVSFTSTFASEGKLKPLLSVAAMASVDYSGSLSPRTVLGFAYDVRARLNNNNVMGSDELLRGMPSHPVYGDWGDPVDDFTSHTTRRALRLRANNQLLTDVLCKEVRHGRRVVGLPTQQQGCVYFDGQSLFLPEQIHALYTIPPVNRRSGSSYSCFELVTEKRFVERGIPVYFEAFDVIRDAPVTKDFVGYYCGNRLLGEDEKKSSLGLADGLVYYDGHDFFLPYVDQRAWQKKETGAEVGFVIVSWDKSWRIALNHRIKVVDKNGMLLNTVISFFREGLYKRVSDENVNDSFRREHWVRVCNSENSGADTDHDLWLEVSRYDQSFLPNFISAEAWFLHNSFRKSALFTWNYCSEFIKEDMNKSIDRALSRCCVTRKIQEENLAWGLLHFAITSLFTTGEPIELLSSGDDKVSFTTFERILDVVFREGSRLADASNICLAAAAQFYRGYLNYNRFEKETAKRHFESLIEVSKVLSTSDVCAIRCILASGEYCLGLLYYNDITPKEWEAGDSPKKTTARQTLQNALNQDVNLWAFTAAMPLNGYMQYISGKDNNDKPPYAKRKNWGAVYLCVAAVQNHNPMSQDFARKVLRERQEFSTRVFGDIPWIDYQRLLNEGIDYVDNAYETAHQHHRRALVARAAEFDEDRGLVPLLRFICEHLQANVRLSDAAGFEPIHHAIFAGNLNAVKLLVEFGADIDAPLSPHPKTDEAHYKLFNGFTPLDYAVYLKKNVVIAYLYKLGAKKGTYATSNQNIYAQYNPGKYDDWPNL